MQLAEQYRPRQWADVVGQEAAVAAIHRVLKRGGCDCKSGCTCMWGNRAWWIVGASGTGKTTLAKLIAAEGAADLCTEEHTAGDLTPAKVRELERSYRLRPLPIQGKSGWCMIVNECHGLRKDTVRALLDTLERLPAHVCWVFTTTNRGQESFFEDDGDGDAGPLVSRCQEIRLQSGPQVFAALAKRAKAVAQLAGCDGLPDSVYLAAVQGCKGNLRMVLQRVESGQLAAEAREELTARLQALPLDGRHGAARAALQAELATIPADPSATGG